MALRAVISTSEELMSEIDTQLPEEDEETELNIGDHHTEILGDLLDAYMFLEWEDLPHGEEYRADLDLVNDVRDKLVDDTDDANIDMTG